MYDQKKVYPPLRLDKSLSKEGREKNSQKQKRTATERSAVEKKKKSYTSAQPLGPASIGLPSKPRTKATKLAVIPTLKPL